MLTWAVRYETPAAGVTQDSTSGRGTTLSVCPTECAPWGTVRRTMVSNYGILNSRECWLFYRRLICQTCPIFVVHFCPRMYFCPRCLFLSSLSILSSCLFLSSMSIFALVPVSALVVYFCPRVCFCPRVYFCPLFDRGLWGLSQT